MVSNFTDRDDLGLWDNYSYQTLVLFGICTVVQCGAIVLNRRTGDQSYSSTELQCSVSLVNIHSAFACLTRTLMWTVHALCGAHHWRRGAFSFDAGRGALP